MEHHVTLQQLAIAKTALLVICPIVLTALILISVLWTNVPAMIIFGVLYVALVTALSVVSVRLRRRTREAARTARNAAPLAGAETLERAGALPGPETQGVFVIGGQTSPAVSGQTQAFSQTHAQRPADDDPPPPYSELPLDVRDKGARVGESVTYAAQRSASHTQSTSVINENVYWNAGNRRGQRQDRPGRSAPPARW